jgi:CubicO group peptidase (beta-lactamase class C family)
MTARALDSVAASIVAARAAPAAAVAAAFRSDDVWVCGLGLAGDALLTPHAPVFDLASVTKPFVAVTAARLAARGVLELETPLGAVLPEARGTPSERIPLILLLAHRGGLEAHRPLFAPLVAGWPFARRAALVEAANARRKDAPGAPPAAGFAPLYSDLGYVLAGAALERVTGVPLDALVDAEVCAPLGLEVRSARRWLAATPGFLARVLPTESVAFRGGIVRGTVHDENAWALAGHGLAGQAGLFGTELAVLLFGCALLDARAGRRNDWLSAAALEPLLRKRPGGSLRAGFDGKSGTVSAAGTRASEETFGHLGFTGTSLWCDPEVERVSVLLSNRVAKGRDNLEIRAVRPRVHDALFAWQVGTGPGGKSAHGGAGITGSSVKD